ncbi:hypothetical protein PROPHIGD91-4_80 [Mycobacterium phage prophi91-4]|nr:hypothetical protein PROPHIGD91-4_80 [Mycobacterium phage prophi91-4]
MSRLYDPPLTSPTVYPQEGLAMKTRYANIRATPIRTV